MFVAITIGTIYFIDVINRTPELNIELISKKKASKIYDNNDNFVKQLTMEDYENVKYEDLPDVFVNALISCEDVRFFMHEGIDLPRLLTALKNDIISMSLKEGASTITQQLIKNMLLSNTKTIERKIQEMYLSCKIEKLYSKKDILEFYCNFVSFDGYSHGVLTASYKFFNKHVSTLTLPEAALLAGVINAPTAYSPIYNPNNAKKRMNTVLHLMNKHGFISEQEKNLAMNVSIESMIKKKENKEDKNIYPYQSYIDVAYKQIYEKTGLDPYTTPMEIYTYMDSALQNKIDKMQNENELVFRNDLQQFASTIINNKNGSIAAIFGGRNYQGQKILNRAYDILIQPASTIKVLLEYALAFEYLNWSNKETLFDIETTYPNSDKAIKNVDNKFMGEISIADAIGYSRNTCAITTLNRVINKIGMDNVVSYLNSINLMDNGNFSYSYGLGGYTYGVSVTNLAAAYSMISRNGLYIEPLTVKYIKLLDGSDRIIYFEPYKQQVLSETTCYLISDVLKQVMDQNIWSIQDCKPKNVNVYAKSGTTSFDSKLLDKLNYPASASKDKWLASYTSDYTIAAWTGFDTYLKDEKTYFLSTDSAANINKKFTKQIYDIIAKENVELQKVDGLVEVDIVKGSNLLATSQVNPHYITKALYKKEAVPKEYFKEPIIEDIVEYDYFIINDEITFIFNEKDDKEEYSSLFDYEKILNGKNIYIDIYENGFYKETIKCEKIVTIPLNNSYYQFDIYYKYTNGFLDGKKTTLDFYL